MIRIERHPTRKQLIVFGLIWLVFFSFWGTASWWNNGMNWKAVTFWSIAFVIPIAGFICSEILRIVYVLAACITFPIGWIVSTFILIVVYYVVLTPIGIVLRVAGYDPMMRHFDPDAETYWKSHKTEGETERYFRQF